MKLLIFSVILISTLFSKTYNFTETRYSDAFDSSTDLKGVINFTDDSLKINYDNDNREIIYKDSTLVIKQDENIIDIDKSQIQRLSSFFEILLLIYSNDEKTLENQFYVKYVDKTILLTPKDDLSQYIEKIVLLKADTMLKEMKLFLNNGDYIVIRIEDEVR